MSKCPKMVRHDLKVLQAFANEKYERAHKRIYIHIHISPPEGIL